MTELWKLPAVPENIPHGDMPGDKICIQEEHIRKAGTIYPRLRQEMERLGAARTVVGVCGGSGVGKSEIASVLAYYLSENGLNTYVLSGDNYPHRIPADNDKERMRVYRQGGLKGLAEYGVLTSEISSQLRTLWQTEADCEPANAQKYEWLSLYQKAGRQTLFRYLGTPHEINFGELSAILSQFHQGADHIYLKRMGREEESLWYDKVDFTQTRVLIVEWTHGNSDFLDGVDIPILLNSTPAETLAHRRARNRDGKTDSAFTTMVLELEQKKLEAQAHKAKIILSKDGTLLRYSDYRTLIANE